MISEEGRFQLLVNAVVDYAIYMLDPDGNVTSWNSGAHRFKGYDAAEIIGRHFSTFYTDEDRAAGLPAYALAIAAAEGKFEADGQRVRKDGTRFWAHVVIDAIRSDAGELLGFAKVTRDISERRQAQEELERAREALFQSQKMQALGELTGGIAHDFNNLMTVIQGSADLLRRATLSEQKRAHYLDAIIQTAERAATLTSHLLAFGRRQALKAEILDVNQRLGALAILLERTVGSKIAISTDLAPDLWLSEIDATQLETALLNAAFNARDAMPDGGELTLRTRNDSDDMICLSVSDTGTGMAHDVASRAFEPFFTTKETGKGTGLGLSQLYGFAAQSGGKAEIESVVGEGTTIRIFLPRTTKPLSPATARPAADISAPSNATVLLVEDNAGVADFTQASLEELGYRVVCARNGEEALSLLDGDVNVDIMFTDIVMPGMNGVDLARIVRQRLPRLSIVLASGYSEAAARGEAKDFPFIAKPYRIEALASLLNQCRRGDGHLPA